MAARTGSMIFCCRVGGKLKRVTVGWISEGFSEQKAADMRRELLERLAQNEEAPALKPGIGSLSLRILAPQDSDHARIVKMQLL